jgi:hypothetical protein
MARMKRFWIWFTASDHELTEMEGAPIEIVIALSILATIALVGYWLS